MYTAVPEAPPTDGLPPTVAASCGSHFLFANHLASALWP